MKPTVEEHDQHSAATQGGNGAAPPEDVLELPLIGVQVPRIAVPWLVAGFVAALVLGWSFLRGLPAVWFEDEGYYSHGILIPFMSIAIIYMRRDQIRKQPIGTSIGGVVVMLIGLLTLMAAIRIDNLSLASFGFIISLVGGIYFTFGSKIGRLCVGPLLFLVFMMPVLGWLIDNTTNPLQLISTKIAAKLLNIFGYTTSISPAYPTLIEMNHYPLNVGGPCSGFKLILSLTAFTTFFIMISNLGWWKNLILLFIINPVLALFINGLRIALIGIVGEAGAVTPDAWWIAFLRRYGDDVGGVFHDYSGYVTLIICFVILHYIVKALEGRQPDAVPA